MYLYVRDVLKGPFPTGEPVISQYAEYAFEYAKEVLKNPFPAGEAVFRWHAGLWFLYECCVLNKQVTDAEISNILESFTLEHMSKHHEELPALASIGNGCYENVGMPADSLDNTWFG